jgi:single-strand DNA-binding protein
VPGFSINTVVVSGNLTRDPELRSLPSGTTVCELGLAVNERNKNPQTNEWEDRPNYFDVTVWGGMGEWAARSLQKGAGLTVEGRLRWEQWESNGEKRSKVKIVANSLVPRDDRAQGGGNGGSFSAARTDVPANNDDFAAPAPAAVGGGGGGVDEDIPF